MKKSYLYKQGIPFLLMITFLIRYPPIRKCFQYMSSSNTFSIIEAKMHRYFCHVITIQNRKWIVCTGNSVHLIKCPRSPDDEGVNIMNHGAR